MAPLERAMVVSYRLSLSIVTVALSMESPYVTSYQSLIVSLAESATVFEIFTLKDRKKLILPTPPLFDAPQLRNAMRYQRSLYTAHLTGYNSVADIMGLPSFFQPLLPPKIAKSRENPIKFDLTPVQGHPRSSILVSMESPYVTSYQSLLVTLPYLLLFSRYSRLTLENRRIFQPTLFEASARGNPLEFRDETYPAKTREMVKIS